MGTFQIISLGLALGTDSFSLSVGIGLNRVSALRVVKISMLFSFMQVFLLIVGYYSTEILNILIQPLANADAIDVPGLNESLRQLFMYVGVAVLFGLGLNMLRQYVKPDCREAVCYSGRVGLFMLSFAVSVDALAAGFGLGMVDSFGIGTIAIGAGLVIWVMAVIGLTLGSQVKLLAGKKADLIGGLILIYLALSFLRQVI